MGRLQQRRRRGSRESGREERGVVDRHTLLHRAVVLDQRGLAPRDPHQQPAVRIILATERTAIVVKDIGSDPASLSAPPSWLPMNPTALNFVIIFTSSQPPPPLPHLHRNHREDADAKPSSAPAPSSSHIAIART
eukprot:2634135-Rhodomonas_salina.1